MPHAEGQHEHQRERDWFGKVLTTLTDLLEHGDNGTRVRSRCRQPFSVFLNSNLQSKSRVVCTTGIIHREFMFDPCSYHDLLRNGTQKLFFSVLR